MATKSKKKAAPTITSLKAELKDAKAALTIKQNEVDELVTIVQGLSAVQAPAPQYPPAQQLPPQPYYFPSNGQPYPYASPPQYPGISTPTNPPPATYPGAINHVAAAPVPIPPQPQAPPPPQQPPVTEPAKVNMELVETEKKDGSIHRELVPVNNPHEIDETGQPAKPVQRINPNSEHGLVGNKPVGPCDICGKMIDDPIHTPWKAKG